MSTFSKNVIQLKFINLDKSKSLLSILELFKNIHGVQEAKIKL